MPPKKAKKPKGSEEKTTETSTPVENPDHPEDIFPILLTSATQELFDCRADEDVTGEKPYKLLKKDDIIQDLRRRAAVSDFSPVKQIVLDYPEDEFLLVFDRDFIYGQSFYLVLTPEAKDRILAPPARGEPEVSEVIEDVEVKKTPEPKEWISLGSEQEIDDESVKETRERLRYKFSRVRRKFGASVVLSDSSAADSKDSYLECASYQDSRFSIKQLQRDCGIQAVPRLQSSSVQTQWIFKRNTITQYEAVEFNKEEKENILQAETLKNFCNLVTPRVLKALQQEQIANVFTDDWKDLTTGAEADDWSGKVSEGLTLYQAFTDQKYSKDKIVSSINWHPTIYGVIAVALTENKEKQSDESITLDIRTSFIVFYSFSDPSHPQLLLECPDEIFAFEFCPSDPNIIVGGCMNGQVVLWDIFKHFTHLQETHPGGKKASDAFDLDVNEHSKTPVMRYTAVSTLESSHKARITDVKWLPRTFEVTKTGTPMGNKNNFSVQFVTCSPDCSILFWDVRVQKSTHSSSDTRHNVAQKNQLTAYTISDRFKHLDRSWKPLFRISLSKLSAAGVYAPLKIDFEPYTCSNTDRSTEEADENEHSSDVIPDYTQLIVHSPGSLTPLADVNTKLYIGTEDGEIVYTDWKLEKEDAGNLHSAKPLYCYNSHHWLVHTVQRSPFLKDIVLTTGGWNFTIWKEGLMTGPLIKSRNSEQQCTAGCWSLSRPAVFFIGKSDGSLEVWNLLKKTSEPVQSHSHIASARITCISPWIASPKQHFLAVTDSLGMVRIFEIPKKLYTPSRNESVNVRKYLELGEEGLRDYMKREELWAREKKEADERKKNMTADKPVKSQRDIEDTTKKDYDEYSTQEESILKAMGLSPAVTQNI